MKRNLITGLSLVVMSVMFSVVGAQAQTARADVPFAFNVGTKQLPAGTYEVRMQDRGSASVSIRNLENGEGALMLATIESASEENGKLVFNHLGGEYFLSQIWSGGGANGLTVPASKKEKALRKELAMAKAQPNTPEKIFVAVK